MDHQHCVCNSRYSVLGDLPSPLCMTFEGLGEMLEGDFADHVPQRRWQFSQHRITKVPDTVLVVHLGANFRNIFVWILQNRRKRFEKVLMKNIKRVRVSPKYHIVHGVL